MKKQKKKEQLWSKPAHLVSVTNADKVTICKCHEKGMCSRTILEKHSNEFDFDYKIMQVAGVKAHATRGTYN